MSNNPLMSFSVKVDLWVPGVVVCATFEHGEDLYYGALINTKLSDTFIENACDAVNTPLSTSLIFRSSYQSESLSEAVPKVLSSIPFKRRQGNRTSLKASNKTTEKSLNILKQSKKRSNIENVSANLPVKRIRKSNECSSVESLSLSKNSVRNSSNSTLTSVQTPRRKKKNVDGIKRKQPISKKNEIPSNRLQKCHVSLEKISESDQDRSCLVSKTRDSSDFSSDLESRTSENYNENDVHESSETLASTKSIIQCDPLKLRLRSIDNSYEIARDEVVPCKNSKDYNLSEPEIIDIAQSFHNGAATANDESEINSLSAGCNVETNANGTLDSQEMKKSDADKIPKLIVKLRGSSSSPKTNCNMSSSDKDKSNKVSASHANSNTSNNTKANTDTIDNPNCALDKVAVESKTVHGKTSSFSKKFDSDKVYFESYPLSSGKILHVHDVVWAKLGRSPWWPARIQSIFNTNESDENDVLVNVSWFGALTCSDLSLKSINLFKESFITRFQRKRKGSYRSAVRLAFSECPHISPEFNNDFDSFVNHCFGKRQNF